jgi:hypothetical protein
VTNAQKTSYYVLQSCCFVLVYSLAGCSVMSPRVSYCVIHLAGNTCLI